MIITQVLLVLANFPPPPTCQQRPHCTGWGRKAICNTGGAFFTN